MDLQSRADDLDDRLSLLELERDRLSARLTRLERACAYLLSQQDLLDRVTDSTGVPAVTTSQMEIDG